MHIALKNYFIPHEGNNFQPHVVHTKRTILYSVLFIALKLLLLVFALSVPSEVYLHPDVLGEQYRSIIELTNAVRSREHRNPLAVDTKLNQSADAKAADMARYHYFSHAGPKGRGLEYFLKQSGYQYSVAGENLAMGFPDALSVVKAWEASPTHYSNLVDEDFKEIGVGLMSGEYQGEPTIYIAEHFGTPESLTTSANALPPAIAGKKIADERWVQIDPQNSRVFWQSVGDSTVLTVRAKIDGVVSSAEAHIGAETIPLNRVGKTNVFSGHLSIAKPLKTFFSPTLDLPTIAATDPTGGTVAQAVNWFNVPRFDSSPWTAYLQARDFLGPITPLFAVSHAVFALATLFFITALAVIMAVEFRREHRHLVGQTALMVVLLVGLWWF